MAHLTLFEIQDNLRWLEDQMEEEAEANEGEISELRVEQFEQMQGSKNDKLCSIGRLLKNLAAEQTAVEAEAKRLTARAKSTQKHIDHIKDWVNRILGDEVKSAKFSDATVKISWRKSQSVFVESPEPTIEEYTRTKITKEWDKTKLKEALVSGAEIKGASLLTKYGIQVK